MRDAGGYFALYCGHDHKNAFVGHVDSSTRLRPHLRLRAITAPSRACTLTSACSNSRIRPIRLHAHATYGDLVERYGHNEARVFIGDHWWWTAHLRDQLRRPGVFATLALLAGMAVSPRWAPR